MNNFQIIQSTGNDVAVESTLGTIQAVNNRLRMLRKYNPGVSYWIDKAPVSHVGSHRVSVSRIHPNDPTADHIVRA